jgi:hypothetical protein
MRSVCAKMSLAMISTSSVVLWLVAYGFSRTYSPRLLSTSALPGREGSDNLPGRRTHLEPIFQGKEVSPDNQEKTSLTP